VELYPSVEEKAVMLLYLVVNNRSFSDGTRELRRSYSWLLSGNGVLYKPDGRPLIGNHTLVTLTPMIVKSRPEEMEVMSCCQSDK